jgi:tRNA nucleotidyltransferase (CCA-adding enzyme)
MKSDMVPLAVRRVCERLQKSGAQAVVVGGCVRDALLGRVPKDWDVATSAHPEDVQKAFRKTIPTGIQHGTVTVMEGGEAIEVTTFRGEGAYSDARRPDHVIFGVTLEEDMSRRDFTVNAMAFDPLAEGVIDPFGGQVDLAKKLLRAVGDAAARFREDGLRVMRAVRFAAVLEFAIEPATLAAIPSALESLKKVAAERVQVELYKLLGSARPSLGLVPMQSTGIAGVILPELTALADVDALPRDPALRLAALLRSLDPAVVEAVCRRLKLSNDDRERVVAVVANLATTYDPTWSDAQVRRFVQKVTPARLPDVFALRGDLGDLPARVGQILAEGQALTIGELAVRGQDVMTALGVRGGKVVGDTLKGLLERVVEDPRLNTREQLLALVPAIAASYGFKPPG